VKKIGNGQ